MALKYLNAIKHKNIRNIRNVLYLSCRKLANDKHFSNFCQGKSGNAWL